MNKTTKIFIGIVVLIFIVIFAWYFNSQKQATNNEPIKIGYIGPLTGDAASIGAPGVAAAQAAIKEINQKGGVLGRSLELIVEDDKCSAEGVQAINALINKDQVVAISGPDCGSAAGPSLPIAQKAGIPVVIRWASVPGLPKIGDYIFRVYPSDVLQGDYAADYIKNKLNKSKVAVMYVQNDYGKGLRDVFVEKFKSLGGEVVLDEGHGVDEKDLKTTLLKVKNSQPEAIFLPSYRAVGNVILKQLKEIGLNVPVIAGDAFDTDEIIKSVEGEGVMFSVAVTNNDEKFQKKVFDLTGQKADKITAPLAYDSIMIIAQAIERAGSVDKVKIKNELKKTSYQGVSYPKIEFDVDGDLKAEFAKYEMRVVRNKTGVLYEIQ